MLTKKECREVVGFQIVDDEVVKDKVVGKVVVVDDKVVGGSGGGCGEPNCTEPISQTIPVTMSRQTWDAPISFCFVIFT